MVLGSYLAEHAIKEGFEVAVFDDFSTLTGCKVIPKIDFF